MLNDQFPFVPAHYALVSFIRFCLWEATDHVEHCVADGTFVDGIVSQVSRYSANAQSRF